VSRVYSARLGGGVGIEPAGALLGTVPASTIWVVRHITVVFRGAPTTVLLGFQVVNGATEPLWWQSGPEIAAQQSMDWAGRHVIEPGDTVTFLTSNPGPWDVLMSGYALATP
jgi:hypothetical protein